LPRLLSLAVPLYVATVAVVRVRPPFVCIRSKSLAVIVGRANVGYRGDGLLKLAALIYIELRRGALSWSRRGGIIELIVDIERGDLNRLGYLALAAGNINLCLKDVNFWSTAAYTDGRARMIGAWASAGRKALPGKVRETLCSRRLAILGLVR